MNGLHFISGLPRSGSTLLAAILKQNPRFVAGMTSPVSVLFQAIEDATGGLRETSVFVTDQQRENLLRGVFEIFYTTEKGQIVFDTSRMWCARMSILAKLFPKSRVICCVRELPWIMDSFERLYCKNDQKPSGIYGYDTTGTVFTRTNSIGASSGVVGFALDAVREAYGGEHSANLLLVDYEDLCKQPKRTLEKIYNFIDEPTFDHDFNHVEYSASEFDAKLGAPGLHTVRSKVEWIALKTILPMELFNRFKNDSFWRSL